MIINRSENLLGQDIPLVRQSLFTDGLFFLLPRKDKNNAKIEVLCLMIKKSMQFNYWNRGLLSLTWYWPVFLKLVQGQGGGVENQRGKVILINSFCFLPFLNIFHLIMCPLPLFFPLLPMFFNITEMRNQILAFLPWPLHWASVDLLGLRWLDNIKCIIMDYHNVNFVTSQDFSIRIRIYWPLVA